MIDIAILGAAGRMGRRLIALAGEHDCRVVAAIVSPQNTRLGQDAGVTAGPGVLSVPFSHDLPAVPKVLIDFSSPEATRRWLDVCRERGIAMVVGTTGLTPSDHDSLEAASKQIPILQASNMSWGMAILSELARYASERMSGCDVAIVEAHHRSKKDAPSGTALMLRDVIRSEKEVPIHSLRIGDEVGRHTILLARAGERLELTHVATSRDVFAHGALRAAHWLATRKAGRYTFSDVVNSSSVARP